MFMGGLKMFYTDDNKRELLQLIGKNVSYYRYHSNNHKKKKEKGFVTVEKLAEVVDSSPNMIYNLTAKNVEQGVSVVFLDKLARALDVALYCFFLDEPIENPPKYKRKQRM